LVKKAIIPGTFDPVTFGHIDIIERGLELFDGIIIAVARNPEKSPLFTSQERKKMIAECFKDNPRVEVVIFDGLLVNFCNESNVKVLLRGLRVLSDFEYEFKMALVNRKLADDVETVFVMPREKYSYISSKLIREIASFNGPLEDFVPNNVILKLREKFK
jgi:pantetheine-phosphate adenylyltransferase